MDLAGPTEVDAMFYYTDFANQIATDFVLPALERVDKQLGLITKEAGERRPDQDKILEATKEAQEAVAIMKIDVRDLQSHIKGMQVIATEIIFLKLLCEGPPHWKSECSTHCVG